MNIICYGDSNTFGYDPRSFLGDRYDSENRWVDILMEQTDYTVVNQGMNGREIPDTKIFLPADTDLLIVMLGTNDLLQGNLPNTVCRKMEMFLLSLNLKPEKILLISPPPMTQGQWVQNQVLIDHSISLGKLYQSLARRLSIQFADAGQWNVKLAYDGVHFTGDGHRAFASALIKFLK